MFCWKCLKATGDLKIGFRSVCTHCGADLHTCTNCRFYAPGKPNDCLVPGTDFVRDREANNFCDEFKANPTPSAQYNQAKEKKKFNSLFKDDET